MRTDCQGAPGRVANVNSPNGELEALKPPDAGERITKKKMSAYLKNDSELFEVRLLDYDLEERVDTESGHILLPGVIW